MSIFKHKPNTKNFRIPQREGYEKSLEHFALEDQEKHVLLQIPTGVGKTALIATLPFGLSKKKVLILTPNLNLSGQMEEDLDIIGNHDECIYNKLNIFSDTTMPELFVLRLDGKANRSDIDESHIVVSNYQQLANVEKWFKNRSDDIDLIIIDEAHHQKAKTYQQIIDFFPDAKVIGLTATPFRSDGQPLDGKNIYTYHFADAVKNGYIRNIKTINVSPKEITLSFDDENGRSYSIEEIVRMKEEAWFRQGIAMSKDCCSSIARKSIEMQKRLQEKYPKQTHQIIATAMSIRHAREFVKPAFEELGLKVGLVSSEHIKTNDAEKKKLVQGKLDVIINVNMLGEGYDHKPLGVASIFKPFASLNPYIQFVGRVLRVNEEVKQCYVVSHLGLNQTQRFKEFKLFDNEDREFLNDLLSDNGKNISGVDTNDEELHIEDDNARAVANIKEVGEDMMEFQSEFVDMDKLKEAKRLLESLSESEKNTLKGLGVDYTVTKKKQKRVVKPKDARRSAKNLLNEKEKSMVTDILNDLGIKFPGRNLNKRYGNFVWVKRWVSTDVNKCLGIAKSGRNNLSLDQIDNLLNSGKLDEIKQNRLEHFKKKLL